VEKSSIKDQMYLNNEMSSEIHDKNIEEDEPNEMIDGELINR
jgi:hypothetical protein